MSRTRTLLLAAAALLTLKAAAPAQELKSQRGFHPSGSYALSDLESISTTNGDLALSVPLASLPAGRNGSTGFTLRLRYSSKLWDSYPDTVENPASPRQKIPANFLISGPGGGWDYNYPSYRLVTENRNRGVDNPDPTEFNVWKLKVRFPDGGLHEFAPRGHVRDDGWYTAVPSAGMTYFSIDGTYTRLSFGASAAEWTLSFGDGTRVVTGAGGQRTYDRNGNYTQLQYFDNYEGTGHPAYKIVDALGRSIVVEMDGETDYVRAAGFGGAPLTATVKWKTVYANKTYRASTHYAYNAPWEDEPLRVVDEIILPPQLGGNLKYKFGYNANAAAGTGLPSTGWGEISSVIMPSGARADYEYELDGNTTGALGAPTYKMVLQNSPKRKNLTYVLDYDGAQTPVTETWLYSLSGGGATITGPDGGVTAETFTRTDTLNWDAGLAYRTKTPDGTLVERVWQKNQVEGIAKANPYVKMEFVSVADAAGNPVRSAFKEYSRDKNGNVTEVREYDWIPYSQVAHDEFGKPTGLAQGTQPVLKRVTRTEYHAGTPDASDTAAADADIYTTPTAPLLRSLARATEVAGDAGALSRTEYTYDDPAATGNLTEQRSWDSTKAALAAPGANGSRLNPGNSVSVTNTYDPANHNVLVSTKDALGNETRYGYLPAGEQAYLYPTEVTAAYGTAVEQTVAREYDFNTGLETRETDANGVVSRTEYDAVGRPELAVVAEGTLAEARTRIIYDDAARRVVSRKDLSAAGDGKLVTVEHYDQLGRVRLARELEDAAAQSETDETAGVKVQTRYLFSGANSYELTSNPYRAATSGAAGGEATMGWAVTKSDQGGRTVEERTVAGAGLPAPWGTNNNATGTVVTSYDANYTTVTDQAGKLRRSSVNALGQLARIDEPAVPAGDPNQAPTLGPADAPLQPTSYSYDALSNLRQITQGQQPRTFIFSSLSRLTSATNRESGTVSYTYDANGNLKTKTDARGVVATFDYDQLNRLKARTYSERSPGQPWAPSVSYTYDDPAIPRSRGRLTKVSSPVSETHYSAFDAQGRVTESRQLTDGRPYVMAYGYDRAGNLISETYPSGRVVITSYDQAGDVASVTGQKAGEAQKTYASEFGYAAHGAAERVRLGNGLWEQTVFNARRQPVEIRLGTTAAPSSLFKLEYSYGAADNNGNVHSQTLTAPGLVLQQSYEYDELSRLKVARETKAQAETWKQTYAYDRFGNRSFDALHTTAGLAGDNPTISADNNRINAAGYDYDPAGNLTVKPGFAYAYDAENRMTSADTGQPMGAAAYSYDGDGRRVKKVTGSGASATVFVYDIQGRMVAEYASAPPQQNGTRYLTADALGTPRVVTDAVGAVKARRDFLPFGEEVNPLTGGRDAVAGYGSDGGLRQKFTGKERDTETGLDYFLARYYSPGHGRFTSPDEFTGGPDEFYEFDELAQNPTFYADLADPQSLNKYAYWLCCEKYFEASRWSLATSVKQPHRRGSQRTSPAPPSLFRLIV